MLFGIGCARQYEVGVTRTLVAVVADVDRERALERVFRHFIGTQRNDQLGLGLGNVGDATLLREAKQQAGHA